MNLLISLYDKTGNWSRPLRKDWHVIQIDIQLGIDILNWDYKSIEHDRFEKIGIIAAQPCTDYAISGAAHFERKRKDGSIEKSNLLVKKTIEIIKYFQDTGKLSFWCIENPRTTLHHENPEVGEIKFKFDPWEFAGWSDNPIADRYNKETWLFGDFNIPAKIPIRPFEHKSPMHGKVRDQNKRSITPNGFSKAFYVAQTQPRKQLNLF